MRVSLTAFAGLLTLGSAALCEPPRAAPQPSQPDRRTTGVVLASAEVQVGVVLEAQPAPV
jgi:Flp pilus assembly protein CpaB